MADGVDRRGGLGRKVAIVGAAIAIPGCGDAAAHNSDGHAFKVVDLLHEVESSRLDLGQIFVRGLDGCTPGP